MKWTSRVDQSLCFGFTLIEVIISTLLVLILFSIVLPAIVYARRQGMRGADIDSMRQVALAGAIYQSDYGEPPVSLSEVSNSGTLKEPGVFKLLLDPFDQGLGNLIATNMVKDRSKVLPFACSFMTLDTLNYPMPFARQVWSEPQAGWAVTSLTSRMSADFGVWGDHYWRIQLDGAVVERRVPVRHFRTEAGQMANGVWYRDFFSDGAHP